MQRFKDKVAIVTGAASGIGVAIAKRFLDDGVNVVLADSQNISNDHDQRLLGNSRQ